MERSIYLIRLPPVITEVKEACSWGTEMHSGFSLTQPYYSQLKLLTCSRAADLVPGLDMDHRIVNTPSGICEVKMKEF